MDLNDKGSPICTHYQNPSLDHYTSVKFTSLNPVGPSRQRSAKSERLSYTMRMPVHTSAAPQQTKQRKSGQVRVCNSSSAQVQPALAVNTPGDRYEQEADHVARTIMQMPESKLQRACPCGGSCPECQSKRISPKYDSVATLQTNADTSPSGVDEVLRSSGRPLNQSVRTFMEPRFGYTFDQVRIHDDKKASQAAQHMNALAFTYGNHIAFADGQYNPDSPMGKRLLAHELTHVVQQQKGLARTQLQRHICDLTCPGRCGRSDCGDPTGRSLAADELARRIQGVRRAISRLQTTYPLATSNIAHWLDGRGATRVIPLSEFNFSHSDTGIPRALLETYRPQFEQGIRRRLNPSHPETLHAAGAEQTLRYCTSVRALPFRREPSGIVPTAGMESDLAVAFGGYIMMSNVRIRNAGGSGGRQEFEILSWRVQLCDRYNYNTNNTGAVPIPAEVPIASLRELEEAFPSGVMSVRENILGSGYHLVTTDDDWFIDIEASGGAQNYNMYSEEFDAPSSVTHNFVLNP